MIVKQIKPRPDQSRLCTELLSILSTSNHAYLESPTATGKTLTMALTGECYPSATKILLAHSLDMVEQLSLTFDKYTSQGLIGDRNNWKIDTWHIFHSRFKAGTLQEYLGGKLPEIVFVDECHIGGSISHNDKPAFHSIKAAANKVIWVSATPWGLDEDLLGQRKGKSAVLPLTESVELGLLNPTEVIRVDCGLKLRVAVNALELSESRTYEKLLGQVFEADSDDILEVYDTLDDELENALGRGLRPSDVRLIANHVARLMADLYLDQHRGQKAIFWVPNQSIAKACSAYIQSRLPRGQRAEAIITDRVASSAEYDYTEASKKSFADPNGDVAVACVVYRLREGFDLPELSLGFDCAWNPLNLRSTVQKIGRLIRTAESKPTGQFYYAVSVKTIAGTKALDLDEGYLDNINAALNTTLDDGQFAAEALIEAGALLSSLSDNAQRTGSLINLELKSAAGRTYRTSRSPLFDFQAVSDYSVVKSIRIEDAVYDTSRERLLASTIRLMDRIEFGPRPFVKAELKKQIRPFFVPNSDLYRQDFYDRLDRIRPALLKELIGRGPVKYPQRIEEIMERIRKGEAPPAPGSPERLCIKKALWPTHNSYRPELVQELSDICPELLPIPKRELKVAAQAHVDRVLSLIRAGHPVSDKEDKKRLERWLSRNCNKFRPEVYDEIANIHPELLPDLSTKADKLRRALTGRKKPTNPNAEAQAEHLIRYINSQTLPRRSSPDWFRLRTWVAANHEKLTDGQHRFVRSRWPAIAPQRELPKDRTMAESLAS